MICFLSHFTIFKRLCIFIRRVWIVNQVVLWQFREEVLTLYTEICFTS